MAKQKFEVGATVSVRYLNMNTSGKIRSYDEKGSYYMVYLPLLQQEILYTSRELEAWN